MVAMNSEIGGWLTNRRNTIRSIATPISTMMPRVMARAIQNGTPIFSMLTKVSAANSTSAPWAKLNTPEAL